MKPEEARTRHVQSDLFAARKIFLFVGPERDRDQLINFPYENNSEGVALDSLREVRENKSQ